MKEVIGFHLERLKEDRIPIPEPTILARSVGVVV
jgi:predicted RNase H-like HicB family nuclease